MSNSNETPKPNTKIAFDELPKARFWEAAITQWEGFWYPPNILEAAVTFSSAFTARNDDVFLASTIKTGTTWLKSIAFCIMKNLDNSEVDMLTLDNPHSYVPTVEIPPSKTKPEKLDIYDGDTARLLHTHLPYATLPPSVKNSACKIVYVARNPKDTLVSFWHFCNSLMKEDQERIPLERFVDFFCSGMYPYGPFFDHVAEYWIESQKRPEKLLFVKYEELKADAKREVCRIAEFLGRPLKDGEVDEVLWRCSLERMKDLEVTKSGRSRSNIPYAAFFRKGEVGDWKNYLTPEMEKQVHESIGTKLEALGLFL